ncbi:MAG: hypothetical protein NWE94_00270 [Candidatus Bathyarchaeota archaeon]|nr:hypothetical protein [Candidatus Bathyarchaeota archaeon]
MAWKNTEKHIQNEQVLREELQPDTLRNIKLPPEQDIKAITGKAKGRNPPEVEKQFSLHLRLFDYSCCRQ